MSRIILISVFMMVLSSCLEEIEIKSDYDTDLLVLNAFVFNDKIEASLSRTTDPTKTFYIEDLLIDGAAIEVFSDDGEIGVLSNPVKGHYGIHGLQLEQDKPYHLKVSADGFPEMISNRFYIQPEILVDSIVVDPEISFSGNEGFEQAGLLIFLKDNFSGRNYYYCSLKGVFDDGTEGDVLSGFVGNDYNVCNLRRAHFALPGLEFSTRVNFFPDNCFDGEAFELILGAEIESDSFTSGMIEKKRFEKIRISLGLIDEPFYNYLLEREFFLDDEGNFEDPFFSVSSVEGGFGRVFTSNLKEWVVEL